MQTPRHGVEADGLRVHLPCQQVFVEFDAAERGKSALHLGVEFVGVSDFGDSPNDVVGVEFGFCLDRMVDQGVKVILTKGACRKGRSTDVVTGRIARPQGLHQSGVLVRGRLEFDGDGELHDSSLTTVSQSESGKAIAAFFVLRCTFRVLRLPSN